MSRCECVETTKRVPCRGANGAGPVMLVRYPTLGPEVLCWVLIGLNRNELEFHAVGAAKAVYMLRVE